MTSELGDARRKQSQQTEEGVQRDGVGQRLAFPRLAVEIAPVGDPGSAVPNGYPEGPPSRDQRGTRRVAAVYVLVRVEMGRSSTEEVLEAGELSFDLRRDGPTIIRDDFVDEPPLAVSIQPFREIDVKADAEVRALSRELSGLHCRRPAHKHTCARDDPLVVRDSDASVDAVASTEIVGIDDEGAGHRPTRSTSRGSSARQS